MTIPIALTIAGSDSSAGAGIQADLKTFAALGVYGTSAITAVSAQNAKGVLDVFAIPPAQIASQITAVLDGFDVKAVKIGMLATADIAHKVADIIAKLDKVPIVLDPVLTASSGDQLSDDAILDVMSAQILPHLALITPNSAEAGMILDRNPPRSLKEMSSCAEGLIALGAKAVLVTGGDMAGSESIDLFHDGANAKIIKAPRVNTKNSHGTGCTLSSAIAAHLAKGAGLEQAVRAAKEYVRQALIHADALGIVEANGPLHHFYERD